MTYRSPFLTLGLLTLGLLAGPACALVGIEPDEIDIGDEGTDEAGGEDDVSTSAASTDGGMEDVGDETDASGDGTDTSEADTGDSGTTGTSDGTDTTDTSDTSDTSDTGEAPDCNLFSSETLSLGDNALEILDGEGMFSSACGSPGPEVVGAFTAPEAGDYSFVLQPVDFAGALYVVRGVDGCDAIDLATAGCVGADEALLLNLDVGETVYVFADSESGGASVTVVISAG